MRKGTTHRRHKLWENRDAAGVYTYGLLK